MIVIRADGNSKIGSGHVMRCMSLAIELKKLKQEVLFVTADNNMSQFIIGKGFENKVLNSYYDALDDELDVMLKLLADYKPSICIVDSYFATEEYLRKVSEVCNTAYFDDYGTNSYSIDVLINYNVFADLGVYEKLYTNASNVDLILGLEYAPLRSEFADCPAKEVKVKADRILLLTGGGDYEHVALNFVEKIAKKHKDYSFDVVAGALSTDIEMLKVLDRENENVNLYVNIRNIHELMSAADIAISASGSTVYELCACGTPMITYTFADNQLKASKALEKKGASIYAGDLRGNDAFFFGLEKKMCELLENVKKRNEMSNIAKTLCDGRGAKRLARALIE